MSPGESKAAHSIGARSLCLPKASTGAVYTHLGKVTLCSRETAHRVLRCSGSSNTGPFGAPIRPGGAPNLWAQQNSAFGPDHRPAESRPLLDAGLRRQSSWRSGPRDGMARRRQSEYCGICATSEAAARGMEHPCIGPIEPSQLDGRGDRPCSDKVKHGLVQLRTAAG